MLKVSITPGSFDEVHYTTSEAAKMLGITADAVKHYCLTKPQRIKGRKLLGKTGPWFIPKSAIEEYRKESSDTGRPKECQKGNGRQHKISRSRAKKLA